MRKPEDWVIKDVETAQFDLPSLSSWEAVAKPLADEDEIAFVFPKHRWNYIFPFRRMVVFPAEIKRIQVEDTARLDVMLTSDPAYRWKFIPPWR